MVDSAGVTLREPLASTAPMPSRLTSVAFSVRQLKVVDCPDSMTLGFAESDAVGAAAGGGGGGGGGASFFLHAPSVRMTASARASVPHFFVFAI